MVSTALWIVSTTKGRLIETMPSTTAVEVYISSSPSPVRARQTLSMIPPWAKRIIQPTIRTVLPTKSGSTSASMNSPFHRLCERASR